MPAISPITPTRFSTESAARSGRAGQDRVSPPPPRSSARRSTSESRRVPLQRRRCFRGSKRRSARNKRPPPRTFSCPPRRLNGRAARFRIARKPARKSAALPALGALAPLLLHFGDGRLQLLAAVADFLDERTHRGRRAAVL